jgi:hypothetical protein
MLYLRMFFLLYYHTNFVVVSRSFIDALYLDFILFVTLILFPGQENFDCLLYAKEGNASVYHRLVQKFEVLYCHGHQFFATECTNDRKFEFQIFSSITIQYFDRLNRQHRDYVGRTRKLLLQCYPYNPLAKLHECKS